MLPWDLNIIVGMALSAIGASKGFLLIINLEHKFFSFKSCSPKISAILLAQVIAVLFCAPYSSTDFDMFLLSSIYSNNSSSDIPFP